MASPKFIRSAIWPDKHKELLKQMYTSGASVLEIAQALNRTRNSIIGFIHRSGLANSRPKKPYARAEPKKPQEAKPKETKKLFTKPIIEVDLPTQSTLFVFTNNRQCKYIADEPNGLQTRVCGKRTMTGTSWCFDHHTIVYTKQPVLNMKGALHG